MRRLFFTILLTSACLGSCELGVRGLYLLAQSSFYRGWHLAHEREGRLELGPVDQRFLGAGFLAPVLAPGGETRVWSGSPRSELLWPLLWRRDRVLQLRVRGFPHSSASGQRLRITLNGAGIGHAGLDATWATLRYEVPAEAQRIGDNVLGLETQKLHPASLLSARGADPRMLGFELDWVELR